jgi:hypothetical protein
MPEKDDDYLDWEANLLTTYPPYLPLFGDTVITPQQLAAKVTGHARLVALRDAGKHAEEYKRALNALRRQLLDGPAQTLEMPRPDPALNLDFPASPGGRIREFHAWVGRIKAAKPYNPESHGPILRIEPGPLPPPDFINMQSTGYTQYDGTEWLHLFRTIPRGADSYHIYLDTGDGREQLVGAGGLSHSKVKAPPLPANGLLQPKLITRLTRRGATVGQPTWQVLNLQRDLPARFGVMIREKKGASA